MTTTKNSFIDQAIDGFKKAATELEEFQVQVALGKAEAYDKYDELKKTFSEKLRKIKQDLKSEENISEELFKKLDELHAELLLGKAETAKVFNEQKEKIFKEINKIENDLKTKAVSTELYLRLSEELKKFRIKMEILKLRFELEKMDVAGDLEAMKAEFSEKADELKKMVATGGQAAEKSWEHFKDKLSDAYSHLKKTFVNA